MSHMEKTEEQHMADLKYIDGRFPYAKFDVSIDRDKLKEIITREKQIIIKQDFCCTCWGCKDIDYRPPNKYFIINNDVMSYENVIDELIRQELVAECDHRFLELITKQTEVQYNLWFGS